ncbi:MAG: hypothetical protein ACLP8S_15250 [Solirubrobacteraceae bacterium]
MLHRAARRLAPGRRCGPRSSATATPSGARIGNANELLFALKNSGQPWRYFHDITGLGQPVTNNGLFPATTGYDMATGIGIRTCLRSSPTLAAVITDSRSGSAF